MALSGSRGMPVNAPAVSPSASYGLPTTTDSS